MSVPKKLSSNSHSLNVPQEASNGDIWPFVFSTQASSCQYWQTSYLHSVVGITVDIVQKMKGYCVESNESGHREVVFVKDS